MGSGRVKIDFSDGYFSDNIINALHKCPAKTWLELKAKGLLRFSVNDYILNHTSLTMDGLDEYAEAAGCRVSDFLLTGVYATKLYYTENDEFVLSALNSAFSAAELEQLSYWLAMMFPNEIYASDIQRVPSRMQLALSLLPYGSLSNYAKLQCEASNVVIERERVSNELERFRRTGYGTSIVFDSNIYPDLAALAGVSLHWILNLKTPLYCNTQTADEIFDRYTLMQPHEKMQLCNYLEGLLINKGELGQSIILLRKQ